MIIKINRNYTNYFSKQPSIFPLEANCIYNGDWEKMFINNKINL